MDEIKSLGQVAFEAYREAVQGVAYDGSGIPPWDSLDGDRAKAQGGWEAAAQAVREHVRTIDALDATSSYTPRELLSRWLPVREYLPLPQQRAPESPVVGGQGEAPTGEPVPVDVEPDA